jgi:hypothetical protein
MVSRVLTRIPLADRLIVKMNMVSMIFGIISLCLLYRTALLLSNDRQAAFLASLALGMSHTFWHLSVAAEVYTFMNTLILLVLYFTLRREDKGEARTLLIACYLIGLSLSGHLLTILVVPALIIFFLFPSPAGFRTKTGVTGMALFLLGFSFLGAMILRDLRTQPLDLTLSLLFRGKIEHRVFHYNWQQVRNFLVLLWYQFPCMLVLLSATAGAFFLWKREKAATVLLLGIVVVNVFFFMGYDVEDRFSFYLQSFSCIALFAAPGIARCRRVLGARTTTGAHLFTGAVFVSVILNPFVYGHMEKSIASGAVHYSVFGAHHRKHLLYVIDPVKRHDYRAENYLLGILNSIPDGAVACVQNTNCLKYLQQVEGRYRDTEIVRWRTIVSTADIVEGKAIETFSYWLMNGIEGKTVYVEQAIVQRYLLQSDFTFEEGPHPGLKLLVR